VGLLQSIGGVRKGFGCTFTGNELQKSLQIHQQQQKQRRSSLFVHAKDKNEEVRRGTIEPLKMKEKL
jgi:hypothetical protein